MGRPWHITHYRSTNGYLKVWTDGIWARAPYLLARIASPFAGLPASGRPAVFVVLRMLTSGLVSDEVLALAVLRYAAERGLLPAEVLAQVSVARPTPTSPASTSSAPGPSAAALLSELLAQQKLTLAEVRAVQERVSAAWVTQEGTLDGSAPGADAPPSVRLPTAPERYQIEGLIGQGGMGQVYKAHDRKLGRLVALKFLHITDDTRARRLFREARAQARIKHPHVCQVYDVGQQDGQLYIAMEYHPGESLRALRTTLRLEEKVLLIKQVADALQAAHSLGIVHRDVKSSNILAQRSDGEGWHAVLLDFGLAHDLEAAEQLTGSGALMGTPAYMSPEQLRGDRQQIDRRSDVYAVGVVLYELITGAPPFVGDAQLIAWRTLHEEVAPPRRTHASVPLDLETIVMTCLQKEARHRYQSAQALSDDLGRFLAGEPIIARRESALLRARRFARRHVAALGISALLLASGAGLLGVSIREQHQADQRARLAQWLGREVELNDMFLRMAYALPLHDVRQEEAIVRTRVAAIERQLPSMPRSEVALAHYAIGRSLLMLRDYESAIAHLQAARAAGDGSPELAQLLGRALVERYQQVQGEFSGWLSDDWIEERLTRLREQYLVPARQLLESGQTAQASESLLNRALLALLRDEYQNALQLASQVIANESWRSEAKKLIGDVHAAASAQHRKSGQHPQALAALTQAQEHYQAALRMARSDPAYFYGAAKLYLNQLSLELYLGKSPIVTHEQLLKLSQELQQLQPDSIDARSVRLTAALIMIRYHSDRREPFEHIESQAMIDLAYVRRFPMSPTTTQRQAVLYATLAEARLNRGLPLGDLPGLAEAAAKQAASSPEHPSLGYQILGDLQGLSGYKGDIDGAPIIEQLSGAIKSYRAAWMLSPKRESFYESALLVARRAVLGLAARNELTEQWLTDAEADAEQGLRHVQSTSGVHHHLGGLYVDIAEVWLHAGRTRDAEALLAKAQPHIEQALAHLPAHAPSHADFASLYRLRAQHALDAGEPLASVEDLLRRAHAAMDRSLALNARDGFAQLAHAKLLLLSADCERRLGHSPEARLAQLEQALAVVPPVGWLAAAAPFLRSEAALLRAQGQAGATRARLIDQARSLLLLSLRHRPQWLLAQRRLAALGPSPSSPMVRATGAVVTTPGG